LCTKSLPLRRSESPDDPPESRQGNRVPAGKLEQFQIGNTRPSSSSNFPLLEISPLSQMQGIYKSNVMQYELNNILIDIL